ncbi:ABC transporter ATP-binding protein [Alicyclobacillus kakegawensis]|uniref:ABC transporter ATP-binding protein n=1 Tax=Alicyclobacillus kakegawensis TaxID=392012 RepID=UPI000A6407C0|nr:ABC transporter ATP-binding protein [Alicyclobacillus kakegawensis]
MAETPALLEVEHLQKTFEVRAGLRTRKLHAVTDVSFTVSDGRATVIVGESGCGKSTVVRLIARLLTPTGGTIRFGGSSYGGRLRRRELLRLRSEVQMIFQDPFGSLNSSHSIGYHLSRPLFNYRKCRTASEARERALQTLESVGLTPAGDYIDKYPHELSGGQRQRVVIARALIVEPKLILADEPTSMLDVSIRMDILNLMRKLQRERGLAFLFITHDLASARYIGDDLLVMYAGELVEGGPVDDVVSAPAHPYTQLLLSAVPDVERNTMLEGETAPGEPPNLSQLPPGCRFHPRCPLAMDVCRKEAPKRVQVGENHWAACHAVQGNPGPKVI